MTANTEPVEVIRSSALDGTAHGFLGRRGGVSTGIHAGLNVGWGSDDERAAIAENRRRAVAAVLPGAALVTVHRSTRPMSSPSPNHGPTMPARKPTRWSRIAPACSSAS